MLDFVGNHPFLTFFIVMGLIEMFGNCFKHTVEKLEPAGRQMEDGSVHSAHSPKMKEAIESTLEEMANMSQEEFDTLLDKHKKKMEEDKASGEFNWGNALGFEHLTDQEIADIQAQLTITSVNGVSAEMLTARSTDDTDRARLAIIDIARKFVPDPQIIQWEQREIELRDAFAALDALVDKMNERA